MVGQPAVEAPDPLPERADHRPPVWKPRVLPKMRSHTRARINPLSGRLQPPGDVETPGAPRAPAAGADDLAGAGRHLRLRWGRQLDRVDGRSSRQRQDGEVALDLAPVVGRVDHHTAHLDPGRPSRRRDRGAAREDRELLALAALRAVGGRQHLGRRDQRPGADQPALLLEGDGELPPCRVRLAAADDPRDGAVAPLAPGAAAARMAALSTAAAHASCRARFTPLSCRARYRSRRKSSAARRWSGPPAARRSRARRP